MESIEDHENEGTDVTVSDVSFVMPSLEDSVAKYPLVALSELAQVLGLQFEKIQQFFKDAALSHQVQSGLHAAKRFQVEEVTQVLAKRQRLFTSPVPASSSVPLEVLFAMDRESSSPSSENETRLTWDKPHLNPPLRVISDAHTTKDIIQPAPIVSPNRKSIGSSSSGEVHPTGAQPLELQHLDKGQSKRQSERQSGAVSKGHGSVGSDDKTEEFSSTQIRDMISRI